MSRQRRHQRSARTQVAARQQPVHRNLYEICIAHVLVAIGEGQPAGLCNQVCGHDAIGVQLAQRIGLQHGEDHQAGHPTRCGGAHAADCPLPVRRTHRLALDSLIRGEVFNAHQARVHLVVPDCLHDGAGNISLVEAVRPLFCDNAHGAGIGRVREHMTHRHRTAGLFAGAVRQEVDRLRAFICLQPVGVGNRVVQARAHLEAVFCKPDGGLEQFSPRQLAELLVLLPQRSDHARHTDRPAAQCGIKPGHWLAVVFQEQLLGCRHWRFLAPVKRGDRLRFGVEVHGEQSATNAR
jgi:hypothetical protein